MADLNNRPVPVTNGATLAKKIHFNRVDMLKFFVFAFIAVGVWWWLIGNRIPEPESAPVQWTALADEGQTVGDSTDANRCLNESLLKSRVCASGDAACVDNASLFASACFAAAGDTRTWCLHATGGAATMDEWATTACSVKGIEGSACLAVAAHILQHCQAGWEE